MLNKAFLLAYFIHGDKEIAVRIVSDAMSKLDVAATAQDKRFYYRPGGRSLLRRPRSIGFRTKVTFNDLHLLQRLVYIESEPHEKQKELLGAAIGKEELIIHFIKHLVRITLKRNSFYVTLGISRLLHNYTTQETMGIYNVVVQDPERVKDDYYYRSRKGVLMQEIKERFGDLVKTAHGQRGEERFQAEPEPSRFAEVVGESLSFFTPWATPCLVPAGFDPISDFIPSLQFEGKDKEDQIEVNRIHAALHPNCYQRLIKALGFHSPDQRLEVPRFFLSSENGDSNQDRRDRPRLELGEEDLNSIKHDLGELAERRRKTSTGLLRISVDGVDYNGIDLTRERRVRLDLNRTPELIEIWTTDNSGDLLLASYLLTYKQTDSEPLRGSTFLEGGQQVSIVVSPSTDASGAVVEIGYEETLQKRIATVSRSLFDRYQFGFSGMGHSRFVIPALSFLLLLIMTGIFVRYTQKEAQQPQDVAKNQEIGSSAPAQNRGSNAAQVPSNSDKPDLASNPLTSKAGEPSQPIGQKPAGSLEIPKSSPTKSQSPDASVERPPTTTERVLPQQEMTRGQTAEPPVVSLANVKRVYVESVEESSGQVLKQMLAKLLQSSGRFTLSRSRDDADALLKVTTRPISSNPRKRTQAETVSVVILVNARGDVIWPVKGGPSRGRYQGLTPEQVSNQVVKDLVEDIEHLSRQH